MADREALETLFARYFPLLREKCRRMVGDGDEAEDLAQETFVRYWRERDSLGNNVRATTAWLYRTSTRLAIDRQRHMRMRGLLDASDLQRALHLFTGFAPDDAACTRGLLARIGEHLGPDELEVAMLCWLDGLTQPEAAELLGVTERTVRRRMRRAEEQVEALRKEYAS